MKYVHPFSDFGFKRLFGEEASKRHLIDFLNALLPAEHQIETLSFRNTEQLGIIGADRKAVFDIYCVSAKGEKFIVEMQKSKHDFFRVRTILYSTFPIKEQMEKNEWNFELSAVYCIAILDLVFKDYLPGEARGDVLHTIKLKNQHCEVFYDKLTFIYLEMPNFNKQEHELETRLDKWLYFLKNLASMEDIPELFKEEVFTSAFHTAEIAAMTVRDYEKYVYSMKVYSDMRLKIDYAKKEGLKAGIRKGIVKGIKEEIKVGREEGIKEGIKEGREQGVKEGEHNTLREVVKRLNSQGVKEEEIQSLLGYEMSLIIELLNE